MIVAIKTPKTLQGFNLMKIDCVSPQGKRQEVHTMTHTFGETESQKRNSLPQVCACSNCGFENCL